MLIVDRSGGEIGNSRVEIVYEVKDGDKPLTLKWFPQGDTIERFRQLKISDESNAAQIAAIAALMGGANSTPQQLHGRVPD
jgi:hypothetical protein